MNPYSEAADSVDETNGENPGAEGRQFGVDVPADDVEGGRDIVAAGWRASIVWNQLQLRTEWRETKIVDANADFGGQAKETGHLRKFEMDLEPTGPQDPWLSVW